MGDDAAAQGNLRKICFILYFIFIELVGCGCLALSVLAMNHEAVVKLRIWERFDKDIAKLPPILTLGASVLTILVPPIGLVGVLKRNQILITAFFGLMTLVAFVWFGIGAWCVSLHKLILGDISTVFEQLDRDGAVDSSDAQQFLMDLKEHMPRINHKKNLQCCQSSEISALNLCAKSCGLNYERLFSIIVLPAVYGTVFGAGGLCILTLVFACLVSCHLDDVKPTF